VVPRVYMCIDSAHSLPQYLRLKQAAKLLCHGELLTLRNRQNFVQFYFLYDFDEVGALALARRLLLRFIQAEHHRLQVLAGLA
jgi:hypothetical protein